MITDHASLLWLRNLKDPSGRLGRWALRLQPYNFDLKHRKGKCMVVADALSRAVEEVVAVEDKNDWYERLKSSVTEKPDQHEQFKVVDQTLFKRCSKNGGRNGHMKQWKEVVKESDRPAILHRNHDHPLSAHGGFFKTADRIKRNYYWPKMDDEIRTYVRNCVTCKACKPTNQIQKSPMGNFREAKRPFEIIYIDFVGPLPRSKSGHAHMLVVVDGLTKFTRIHPVRAATTESTIKYLRDHIFLVFGVPKYLVCDNGPQFTATKFQNFLQSYGVTLWYSARYHPQANAAEAANKTAETAIRAYLKDDDNHKAWDANLAEIACAMNTARHTSTMVPPFFALFGKHMCTSATDYITQQHDNEDRDDHEQHMSVIQKLVRANLKKAYENSKRRYDLRTRSIHYNVGEKVWLKSRVLSNAEKGIAGKLMPNYRQCYITKKIGTNSYEAMGMDGKTIGIFNTDCFKK